MNDRGAEEREGTGGEEEGKRGRDGRLEGKGVREIKRWRERMGELDRERDGVRTRKRCVTKER